MADDHLVRRRIVDKEQASVLREREPTDADRVQVRRFDHRPDPARKEQFRDASRAMEEFLFRKS